MFKNKKYAYILIGVIALLVIGGALAYYVWESSINALIYGEVCAPEVAFVGGSTINGTGIKPVSSYEKGLSKEIRVNLENLCDNDTATMSLKMQLELFPEGLADSSFKWILFKEGEENALASGNFQGKQQGQTYTLVDQQVITGNVSTYTLYLYLDGNMDNPIGTQNQVFRINLYGEGRDAIYNEYTMKQASSTSATTSFWGSSINANQVKSIRFVKKSEVPTTYTGSYDVSSIADSGDVMMYYVEDGQTEDETPITLYDVYVASTNGSVKTIANADATKMFAYLSNCESIDVENLDVSNVTNMKMMFSNDKKLMNIKFTSWDTSNVENMQGMFGNCKRLTYLNLSHFNTSNVKMMAQMFMYSTGLTYVNLSNFDCSSVTAINGMFMQGGNENTVINLNNWNTSNMETMKGMFNGYFGKSLDLSSFDTSNVTNMEAMFGAATNLEYVNLSSFNTSNVENMSFMFNAVAMKEIDLSNFDSSSLTDMSYMFSGAKSVEKIDLSNFDFSGEINIPYAFGSVPSNAEIIVKDCTEYNNFVTKFGSKTNLHTVNNDNCSA